MTQYSILRANPLWRIRGFSRNQRPVEIKVRAADYFAAVAIAKARTVIIRDVVLIEA